VTITVPTAAVKDQGICELLDYILLQAECARIEGQSGSGAGGIIIESQIDVGRGPSATVIVQRALSERAMRSCAAPTRPRPRDVR